MASNIETKKSAENTSEQDEAQKKSPLNFIIRAVLILGLVVFMVKPYLDKPRSDDGALQTFKVRGETMGTTWHATIVASPVQIVKLNQQGLADGKGSAASQNSAADEEYQLIGSCEEFLARVIQNELDKIDSAASTYLADSEICKFNASQSTDWFPVSQELAEIVATAVKVSEKTHGAYDVTVAPLVNLYRFGPNKAPLAALPDDDDIAEIKRVVGYDKLQARTGADPAIRKAISELSVDLSSVAKGYAVDLAAMALENAGLNDYMLEVGGEIRCRGAKLDPLSREKTPWTLGIQTPEVVKKSAGQHIPDVFRRMKLGSSEASAALATSGDYNNYLQVGDVRFSHIIDPRTGKPTEIVEGYQSSAEPRLGSVSVVSDNCNNLTCAEADAYATAFFVLGQEEGLTLANELGIPVLFLYRSDDSASEVTEALSDSFSKRVNSRRLDEPEPEAEDEENDEPKRGKKKLADFFSA